MKLLQKGCKASSALLMPTTASKPTTWRIATTTTTLTSAGRRALHTTPTPSATPLPHPIAPGPPPAAPTPSPASNETRIDRKKRNAELLARGRDWRAAEHKPGTALQKRFWKDVTVTTTEAGDYQVYLDKRPVRTPSKNVLTIPRSKPNLATSIALEWDLLVSAMQALKGDYIPMTSLTSRALDIAAADAAGDENIRHGIVRMCMRYFSTDTILCWAPEVDELDPTQKANQAAAQDMGKGSAHPSGRSLRQLQEEAAKPILAHLTGYVWPGVEIVPALQDGSILPRAQPEGTTEIVRGWVSGLGAWELAGLERAVLASKSLCVGTRLVVEWSQQFNSESWRQEGEKRFAIEEAAEACSQEVRWQTGMWGEVEDTHDVEKEDMRRQLGSVILLLDEQSSS